MKTFSQVLVQEHFPCAISLTLLFSDNYGARQYSGNTNDIPSSE